MRWPIKRSRSLRRGTGPPSFLGPLLSQLASWAEVARVTFPSALYIDCTNGGPHSEHLTAPLNVVSVGLT